MNMYVDDFFSKERFLRSVCTIPQALFISFLAFLAGVSFVFVLREFHVFHGNIVDVLLFIGVFPFLVLAALVDSVHHLLPDPLLLCALVVSISTHLIIGEPIIHKLVYFFLIYIVGTIVSHVIPFGRGDVKLLAVLSVCFAHPVCFLLILLLALLLSAFYSLYNVFVDFFDWKTEIAFGPWLVVGSFIVWGLQLVYV
ncbi:MAG: prepilin peptidase [Actinomycetaceae bacterium]|nr:prepilin peptidase [Actinomycetaceae bacterium]